MSAPPSRTGRSSSGADWFTADFAAAGISKEHAERVARSTRTTPAVAATLLACGFEDRDLVDLATVLRPLPETDLAAIARTRFLHGSPPWVILLLMSTLEETLPAWMAVPGATFEASASLSGRRVDPDLAAQWARTYRSTAPHLWSRIQVHDQVAGTKDWPVQGWLEVAVTDTRRHRGGAVAPIGPGDGFLGGRTGLYWAAGLTPVQARQETRQGTPDRLAALHTLAALRGGGYDADLAWWASR